MIPLVSSPRRRRVLSLVTAVSWPAHRQRTSRGADADGGDGTTSGRRDAGVRYDRMLPGQSQAAPETGC